MSSFLSESMSFATAGILYSCSSCAQTLTENGAKVSITFDSFEASPRLSGWVTVDDFKRVFRGPHDLNNILLFQVRNLE